MCISLYLSLCLYTYIYIYIEREREIDVYNLPLLDDNPPNKTKPCGEDLLFIINLDGGTNSPLINGPLKTIFG